LDRSFHRFKTSISKIIITSGSGLHQQTILLKYMDPLIYEKISNQLKEPISASLSPTDRKKLHTLLRAN
jgi:hypothetical protein